MLETYVIVPLNKYDALQEQIRTESQVPKVPLDTESKEVDTSTETFEDSAPLSSGDSEAEMVPPEKPTESFPSTTKQLINSQKLRESYFEKCLRILEKRGIGQLNLPNLKDLVRIACSTRNSKKLPNESTFYAFLIDHGLM